MIIVQVKEGENIEKALKNSNVNTSAPALSKNSVHVKPSRNLRLSTARNDEGCLRTETSQRRGLIIRLRSEKRQRKHVDKSRLHQTKRQGRQPNNF